MALIRCPDCEKEISGRAYVCPHCGKLTKFGYPPLLAHGFVTAFVFLAALKYLFYG